MSKKPFSELALNRPACDWITLSSWHVDAFDRLIENEETAVAETRLNYGGKREGKLFVGTGEQNGFMHKMLQVSGSDADLWLPALTYLEDVTCTHLDLQVTVEWPGNDLFALCGRMLEKGKTSNFDNSFKRSRPGDTCYIGSRLSEKYIRVYHKSKSKNLVRFEVAYKKTYAKPMFEHMAGFCDDSISRWLSYELYRTDDNELIDAFCDSVGENPIKPPRYVPRPENDTERWLRKIVAPAILKYRNSHDADPYLLDHLINMIGGPNEQLSERSNQS